MAKKLDVAASGPETTIRIPLEKIVFDATLQPRQEIEPDEEWIQRLIEAGPDAWPPILVFDGDVDFLVLDGRHRFLAAARRGLADVAATIVPMPEDGDLRGLAYRLNRKHGKRR
jgi:ParB-like chromosome segregation protein Spo0J